MIITNGIPVLPHDPLEIKSMADYDLSLALSRPWLEFNEGRLASPGVIKSWEFKSGKYILQIDQRYKWSNGLIINSKDLEFNFKRITHFDSTFSQSIKALVDIDHIATLANDIIVIPTLENKNNIELLHKLSTAFYHIVHPSDCANWKVVSNHISIGPYIIKSTTKESIVLIRNEYYPLADKRPATIKIIKESTPSVQDFLSKKTGLNLIQTTSLMDIVDAKNVEQSKLSIWTRGHDRVALLKPNTQKKNLSDLLNLLRYAGKIFSTIELPALSFKAVKAKSLQPIGYPLFQELVYPDKNDDKVFKKISSNDFPKHIKIITPNVASMRPLQMIVDKLFNTLNVSTEWCIVDTAKDAMLNIVTTNSDFILFSFGVADPEASTWLSLVMNKDMPFVYYTNEHYELFIDILKVKSNSSISNVSKMRELLANIAYNGGYLPIAHFSTMSLAFPNIDLTGVHALDETVDFSKITIKE